MTAALCVICAADEPQPVICRRCEDRIRRDLDNVAKMRHDLDGFLLPSRGRGGKAPGKPGSKPPARIDVLAATDRRTRRIVAGWHDSECGDAECIAYRRANNLPECEDKDHRQSPADDVVNIDACLLTRGRMTVEERQLAHPPRDVFDVIRILNLSRDWWCRHPAVDEFASEIRDCAIALRRLIGDVAEPVVGKCPALVEVRSDVGIESVDCGGPLRLEYAGVMLADQDAPNSPTGLVCGRCGGRWDTDAATMVQFLRVVQPKARFPVPRDWALREYGHLGLTSALLRQWVCRGHVKGYHDGQVDLVAVLARMTNTPTTPSK